MANTNDRLPLELARKQKRLRSWRERFSSLKLADSSLQQDIETRLNTYSLLIAKLAAEVETSDLSECKSRIADIERSLNLAFDSERLVKSRYSSSKK